MSEPVIVLREDEATRVIAILKALMRTLQREGPRGSARDVETVLVLLGSAQGERNVFREAAAFRMATTDDSQNEPPDFDVPGDEFGG